MQENLQELVSAIPGWLTIHEGQFLEKVVLFLNGNQGAIVEIGSYMGKSTICLAQSKEKVYAIDPHKGAFSGGKTKPTLSAFLHNLKRAGVSAWVSPIVKTSKDAAGSWTKPIKFLFIDGLHDFDHALEDFTLWSKFVGTDGIVAMHDAFCGWEGAGDVAMRHIVYSPDFGEIGVVGSIIYGKKGKLSAFGTLDRLRNQLSIELCQAINRVVWIPKGVKFILIHKFLRICLVNRFTSYS